jgi:23S rRNA pseudouridine2605 synthase
MKSPTRKTTKTAKTVVRAKTRPAKAGGGRSKSAKAPGSDGSGPVRLQIILSRAGVASRRAAETLIADGQVSVNGRVVTELGTKADPAKDHVRVDGRLLKQPRAFSYFVLNKPPGVVTTLSDPEGRPSIGELVDFLGIPVHPVGRLDYHSAGLLLVTNDGELTKRLTHPRYHVDKVYRVKASRVPGPRAVERLRKGLRLEDGKTGPARVHVTRSEGGKAWLELTIREGRNRQVRRMLEKVGVRVEKLRRTAVGPIKLGRLPTGNVRPLTKREVEELRAEVGLD